MEWLKTYGPILGLWTGAIVITVSVGVGFALCIPYLPEPKAPDLSINRPTCELILPTSEKQISTIWLEKSDEHGYILNFRKDDVTPVTGGKASVAVDVE